MAELRIQIPFTGHSLCPRRTRNRVIFKRAQKLMPQIRQAVDGGERFIFAVAQCRIDQTSLSHEPYFVIGLSAANLEKAVALLVNRDQEFLYVS